MPRNIQPVARVRAFTLPEVLMATSVLAIAVAALAHSVTAGQAQTYDALASERALALAEALMEEISSLPYDDPQGATALGPDSGESSRAAFDNVDDFHNFSENAGALKDAAGSLYPASHQAVSRRVTITAGTQSVSALGGSFTGQTVTVTVEDAGGREWTVTRFFVQPESGT